MIKTYKYDIINIVLISFIILIKYDIPTNIQKNTKVKFAIEKIKD